ncbi:hypothetical protein BDR26DRAFT_871436 [Obelidium mucronatum]|nr:hypothetical protein BDR26DRAFT_871436 [Obelidium mucronatum]
MFSLLSTLALISQVMATQPLLVRETYTTNTTVSDGRRGLKNWVFTTHLYPGFDWYGFDVQPLAPIQNVANANDCASIALQKNILGAFFTYNYDNKLCYLKWAEFNGNVELLFPTESTYMELHTSDLPGKFDTMNKNVKNALECVQFCTQNLNQCAFPAYNPYDKQCFLKAPAPAGPNVYAGTVTTFAYAF